jgi:hypothetical protein
MRWATAKRTVDEEEERQTRRRQKHFHLRHKRYGGRNGGERTAVLEDVVARARSLWQFSAFFRGKTGLFGVQIFENQLVAKKKRPQTRPLHAPTLVRLCLSLPYLLPHTPSHIAQLRGTFSPPRHRGAEKRLGRQSDAPCSVIRTDIPTDGAIGRPLPEIFLRREASIGIMGAGHNKAVLCRPKTIGSPLLGFARVCSDFLWASEVTRRVRAVFDFPSPPRVRFSNRDQRSPPFRIDNTATAEQTVEEFKVKLGTN